MLHALRPEQGSPGRYSARIDSGPAEFAGQPAIFDLGAAIHHDLQPRLFGEPRRFIVAYPELHPHDLSPELNGVLCDSKRGFGRAEDVDDVDRLFDIGQRGIDMLAQDLLTRLPRIDRDHAKALLL